MIAGQAGNKEITVRIPPIAAAELNKVFAAAPERITTHKLRSTIMDGHATAHLDNYGHGDGSPLILEIAQRDNPDFEEILQSLFPGVTMHRLDGKWKDEQLGQMDQAKFIQTVTQSAD